MVKFFNNAETLRTLSTLAAFNEVVASARLHCCSISSISGSASSVSSLGPSLTAVLGLTISRTSSEAVSLLRCLLIWFFGKAGLSGHVFVKGLNRAEADLLVFWTVNAIGVPIGV